MADVTVQEIAAALYTTPQRAVQQAKEWADELHKLRGRLVSWASSYRLIERELTGRLDLETPFDAARSNAITSRTIEMLKGYAELLEAASMRDHCLYGPTGEHDRGACLGCRLNRAVAALKNKG